MSRSEALFQRIERKGTLPPKFIEKELLEVARWSLVPAIISWLGFGIVYNLGYHLTAIVMLGVGLTSSFFVLASRLIEQLSRLVNSNYFLLEIAVSELDRMEP